MRRRLSPLLFAALSISLTVTAPAYPDDQTLFDVPLQDLVNMNVTSVSKREEKRSTAAAAIYVITNEDIHRYGALSVPEALRLAPGVQVARIDNSRWAISIRGFNAQYSDKLLVLIDGRSVYSPVTSGVFWSSQFVDIADVDRIEVIRGPGATLWGSNAVNGVINIITKPSQDTRGVEVNAGGGNELHGFASARSGFAISDNATMRIYASGFDSDAAQRTVGDANYNNWQSGQAGFRTDIVNGADEFTVEGDYYDNGVDLQYEQFPAQPPFGTLVTERAASYGGNLQSRWQHTLEDQSVAEFQMYYSGNSETQSGTLLRVNIFDAEGQYTFKPAQGHEVVTGAGVRTTKDSTHASPDVMFDPGSRAYTISNFFAQDAITIVPNEFTLTVGSKLEVADLGGFEVQPSIRFSWALADTQTVWGAYSRAARSPSRTDENVQVHFASFPGSNGTVDSVHYSGSSDINPEYMNGFELGYRYAPIPEVNLDVATFYNHYSGLVDSQSGTPFLKGMLPNGTPQIVIPLTATNGATGDAFGGEVDADWQAYNWWRLEAWYALLSVSIDEPQDSAFQFPTTEGVSPRHEAMLRSKMDLYGQTTFDVALRFVSDTSAEDATRTHIPSYLELDARLGWKLSKSWEFSVAGFNLLDQAHTEFISNFSGTLPAEVRRSYYGMFTYTFE